MPRNFAVEPANFVRRSDRAIDDEGWIVAFLKRAPMGMLATVYNGQPFLNSNLFAYDETRHAIYMHTARYGRTQVNVQGDEKVCFSVAEMGRLLPADEALEFSVEYAGVVVFGRASIVQDYEEARYGLQMILDKYAPHLRPGEHYRPTTDAEIKRTAVYRIAIDSWSGKRKQVEEFPGAYWYRDGEVVLEDEARKGA